MRKIDAYSLPRYDQLKGLMIDESQYGQMPRIIRVVLDKQHVTEHVEKKENGFRSIETRRDIVLKAYDEKAIKASQDASDKAVGEFLLTHLPTLEVVIDTDITADEKYKYEALIKKLSEVKEEAKNHKGDNLIIKNADIKVGFNRDNILKAFLMNPLDVKIAFDYDVFIDID